MSAAAPAELAAEYFDGRSARPQPVRLRLEDAQLCIAGEGVALRVPVRQVQWPERQRHGPRVAHLADGGSLHCADAAAWDAWARQGGRRESWVVRAQQSWRATLAATAALLMVSAAVYQWGLPWAARSALGVVPASVDAQLGQAALDATQRDGWLQPSGLPAPQQARLRAAFEAALQKAYPGADRPAVKLHFFKSRLGPNAFALPGGLLVVTDEMVQMVDGREDVLIGVLGHEVGHVKRRHGMRAVTQAALLGTITSVAFGDFSGLLAGAPALLGHLAYSRDFEREADADAITMLRANGLSPEVMVLMFDRLAQRRKKEPGLDLGIALASHPADEERITFFRKAAAAQQ